MDATSDNDEATLGSYNKLRWAVSRQQAVADGVTLFASVQGQHTGSKPLDSSDPPCQYDLRHLPPVQLQSRR